MRASLLWLKEAGQKFIWITVYIQNPNEAAIAESIAANFVEKSWILMKRSIFCCVENCWREYLAVVYRMWFSVRIPKEIYLEV